MQRTVDFLSEEQRRIGHDVVVVTLTTTGQTGLEVTSNGVRIYRVRPGFTWFRWAWQSAATPHHPPFPDPIVSWQLRKILKMESPDVLYAHNWMIFSYLLIKGRNSPPVLWQPHDYSVACPKKTNQFHRGEGVCPGSRMRRCLTCSTEQYGRLRGILITCGLRFSRLFYRRVDEFIPNAIPVSNSMKLILPTRTPVRIIYSAIPRSAESEAEGIDRPDFLPPNDGYICYVGNMGAYKGLGDLLEAYQILGADAPPLVVLGIPSTTQPTHWPSGVIVRENVTHADVMKTWKHCAFGVVPSRWAEPYATVAIECGAMGRAIIVTNVGGLPHIVKNKITGLVVPPRNPVALAAAMTYLLENPAKASEYGAAAIQQTKDMRLDVMSNLLLERAEILLSSSTRP